MQEFTVHIVIAQFALTIAFLGSEDLTYTVEEAVEKLGFGPFQLIVTVFSGLLWVSVSVWSSLLD